MNAQQPLTVHPAAECFRLMTDEELAALAADIVENGQHDPIILGRVVGSNEQHQIVDGRNRAKACGIAGVLPKFETREFESEEDIRAFVKSRSERRDLSKGERAMSIAMLYPDPERGRGKIDPARKETETVSFSRIKVARQVFRSDPDLALRVRDGAVSFDKALEEIIEKQKRLTTVDEHTARLRKDAPNLADLVGEERMTLDDAIAALDERERKAAAEEKNKRDVQMRLSEALYRGALAWANPEFVDEIADRMGDDEYRKEFLERLRFDPSTMKQIVDGVTHFYAMLEAQEKDNQQ